MRLSASFGFHNATCRIVKRIQIRRICWPFISRNEIGPERFESHKLCVKEQNLVDNTNILHQNALWPKELDDLAAFLDKHIGQFFTPASTNTNRFFKALNIMNGRLRNTENLCNFPDRIYIFMHSNDRRADSFIFVA
jgi:hypothetical protein